MKKIVIVPLFFLALPLLAQRDFSKVEIKATKVGGSIHMLQGAGGNIALSVGEDGVVMIDDQYAPLAPKIQAAIKGLTDQPLRFVINTHWHGDHTGGNETFGAAAPLVAHTNVRRRLENGGKIHGEAIAPRPKVALPVITFKEGLVLHLNGEDIRAVHYGQAHTDGDSVIYFTRSNVVHMGDNFFTGRFPFVDLESGGTVRGLIDTVRDVLAEVPADAKIIPGHGPLSTVDDLKDYLGMLEGSVAAVDKATKAGMSVEEMKKEKILSPWSKFDGGWVAADSFIQTIADDPRGQKVVVKE